MARSWLIDSRELAKKVINAGLPAAHQIKDCGENIRCPKCHHLIDNSDISNDWPGFPPGVKFDPSDVELLDYLAAKQGVGKSEPHVFTDVFISTLEDKEGICCTHPENLPGARKDGSNVYFFNRISNAYASGGRKRRRVNDQESTIKSNVRWHKTGKTKAIIEYGVVKGFKKIMVLYANPKKGSKPERCNWVMHQYHLGADEDEKEGEYVVSKICYQPAKNELPALVMEKECDIKRDEVIPTTPKSTATPDPPTQDKTPSSDCLSKDYFFHSHLKEMEQMKKPCHAFYSCRLGDDDEYATCFNANTCYGIGELDNLELDTPPDFHLDELQFDSQDSIFGSLDL